MRCCFEVGFFVSFFFLPLNLAERSQTSWIWALRPFLGFQLLQVAALDGPPYPASQLPPLPRFLKISPFHLCVAQDMLAGYLGVVQRGTFPAQHRHNTLQGQHRDNQTSEWSKSSYRIDKGYQLPRKQKKDPKLSHLLPPHRGGGRWICVGWWVGANPSL